jgi:uncharacterized protein (DUF362 family)
MFKITRRWLMLLSSVAAFLFILGRRKSLGMFFARPQSRKMPEDATNLFTENGRTLVGMAAGDAETAVRTALDLIGGLKKLDARGKTVLVKPNVVSGKPHPVTTSPAVVEAVVKLLYAAGAARVYVGDMSALITLATSSTLRHMEKNGIRSAAERAGAEVVGFEDHGWVEVPLAKARYLDRALVTEWLFKVDLVVNLPVVKTHRSASYSICLKNFIGCTHLRQRPYLVDASHWEELVAEFNLAFRPNLHIVDGTVSMVEGGPWEGAPSRTGVIIASGDPVAADVVGLAIIRSHERWDMVTGKEVWHQTQIRHALALGLGSDKEGITLRTAGEGEPFTELVARVREQTGLKSSDRGKRTESLQEFRA